MRTKFVVISILSVLLILLWGIAWRPALWLLVLAVPLIVVGLFDMLQSEHSLRRNFPLVSRGRWLMEGLRPFVRQYLFESETDGAPVPRMFRSVVYQRAKGQSDTVPFGTKYDTYNNGYEWIAHSMGAIDIHGTDNDPRVLVGGPDCTQPYSASLLNISAMSFGALSSNAIRALNGGAFLGGFAHNTGEGGLSRHHLEGGDIIWQVGTGYFGCRSDEGGFDADKFAATAARKEVKMIEIKVSQGAKPGHGGILPAIKNTQEIADARGVEVGTMVASPPAHSAFSTPLEFMHFIAKLRTLSNGKPIGFKLCVGRESEVVALCKAMLETGIKPDFITVDGGEGGTGAAPLEFSNSVGMPLRDGLAFVCDCLSGFDLKKDVRVIAVGKIFTAFHVVKNLSVGADMCYSARGFMMSLGCVQSLVCNTNHCPTGVATQDAKLAKGLVVSDKRARVHNFHAQTIEHVNEIVAAAGLRTPCELNRTHVYRRVSQSEVCRYDQIFEYTNVGSLLSQPYPARFEQQMAESDSSSFLPRSYVAQHSAGIKVLDEAASA
ncbi:FMN-binding glutamate synthase family protein [Granulosicoccus antarcticus]|uniref:Glutamate synthase [NADPH] large chain n=1 Tax=Granulosicoccus antarcticus IMCC3135 TaxID=1192854 RepID=A0A2Z2P067_9GAMM|nr:FMN-binding glutamate synthase family protein [Granulosicoccus antarcticus]ASJ75448.1 Glutamate synthase [NADPH] large chain [Granulosicoccus antarcticus IMCC3135]